MKTKNMEQNFSLIGRFKRFLKLPAIIKILGVHRIQEVDSVQNLPIVRKQHELLVFMLATANDRNKLWCSDAL